MHYLLSIVLCLLLLVTPSVYAQRLTVALEVPAIDANPYHKPYVAVWLEDNKRQPVATLAVWHERDTWLKDLRQWWRKVGRDAGENLDAVTGATRKPGVYSIAWSPVKTLTKGTYLLNIEASREEGDRSYIRHKIQWGAVSEIRLPANGELGEIVITTE